MYQQQPHHHHHHHSADGGSGTGSNINVPDDPVRGPVVTIVVIAAMWLSACGAEGFDHSYVVFNTWLAGSLIALVIVGAVVWQLRRPARIRRAQAETDLAYEGVVEKNQPMVGVSTPNVVAHTLTIRCQDGSMVKAILPAIKVINDFQVGNKVVKRSGERWPRDVRGGEYQVIP